MEPIGWNYDHVNTEGRNIFFFRDTGHPYEKIQETLVEEVQVMIDRNFFDILLVEGMGGDFSPLVFDSEAILKQKKKEKNGSWHASQVLAYRSQKADFNVYGIDDKKLCLEQLEIFKKMLALLDENKSGVIPPKNTLKFKHFLNETYRIANRREYLAATNITNLLNDRNLNTAGVLFGDGHFEGITGMLEGVGYAHFFPGSPTIKKGDSITYLEHLVEIAKRL